MESQGEDYSQVLSSRHVPEPCFERIATREGQAARVLVQNVSPLHRYAHFLIKKAKKKSSLNYNLQG